MAEPTDLNMIQTPAISNGEHSDQSEDKQSQRESQDYEQIMDSSVPRSQDLANKTAKLKERLASLQAQKAALVAQIKLPSGATASDSLTEDERDKSAMAAANRIIKEHIVLLQQYNEIKDIGQGLMGLIAERRNVRIATVMEDFEMHEND